jgi:radical SAM protein with 4Fe4S-binding SPASM domain
MRYQMHSDIGLRNDIDRNILYVRNPVDSLMPDFVRTMNTPASILLALFDGERTLTDVVRTWSQLIFDKSPDSQVHQAIETIMKSSLTPELKIKDILVKQSDSDGTIRDVPDIRELIVERSKVNLDDVRLRIPLRILFIPTLKCTQRCFYCYSTQSYNTEIEPLSFERLTEIFKEARQLGMEFIDLSGGEPFACQNIFQFLEVLRDIGITPNIPTKYPLTKEEVERLKSLGIESLQISIDAITPGLLEHIVGVKGYAERIIDTFRYFEEMGIRLRINTVITPFNIDDIENLVRFLTSFDNLYRVSFSPYAKSRYHHKDCYYLAPKRYSELVEKAKEIFADFPDVKFLPGEILSDPMETPQHVKEKQWGKRSLCTGGRQAFVLLPDGKVTMCEELYYHPNYLMGDLKKQSIMEMWESEEALRISYPDQRQVPDGPCRYCEEFAECHIFPGRCVREAIKTYGEERHYFPDPRCPKAPLAREIS